MATFKKEDLVKDYAAEAGISLYEAERRIEAVLSIIARRAAALKPGETLKISRFFNFHMRARKEKAVKNPLTGEAMIIPATKSFVIHPSKHVKDLMKGEAGEV